MFMSNRNRRSLFGLFGKKRSSFHGRLLDAIPLVIFVVDNDVRIVDYNNAAAEMFSADVNRIFDMRGGEVLHCLHRLDVPGGCGKGPFCQTCVIRNSVALSAKGNSVIRTHTKLELCNGSTGQILDVLITTSPMPSSKGNLSILIVEDVSEISKLRELIPICTKCKKIRDDQQYWHTLESFFKEHIGVNFTHGVCPTCMKELYPDFVGGSERENQ